MASDKDATNVVGVPPRDGTSVGLGRLWQVPVFLLGLAALGTLVVLRWPQGPVTPASVESELHRAREALERSPPDLRQAEALAQAVIERADVPQSAVAEARFVVGSALAREAASTTNPRDAGDLWQKARDELAQARSLGVPDADKDELALRLGKALCQTGGKPDAIVELLAHTRPSNLDERLSALEMLTRAYLDLPAPDLEAALQTNEKLLSLPLDGPTRLAPARLLRGELLIRAGRRAEARLVLASITPQAPHDVYARARCLQAELFQQDEQWNEARNVWREALTDAGTPAAERPRINFNLGLCYAHLGAVAEAMTAWQEAMRCDGEVGQAAALHFAEQATRAANAAAATSALTAALRSVSDPTSYRNSLVSLTEARRIYEEACVALRQRGDAESSRQLALVYAVIAAPGRAQELLARALDGLAAQCQQRAAAAASKSDAHREEETARSYLGQAGAACDAAAEQVRGQPAEPAFRWQAIERYLHAQDSSRAAAALKVYVSLAVGPERAAEGWYVLGTVLRTTGNDVEAIQAFHRCIEIPQATPFAYRARYELAEAEIRQDRFEEAESILRQALDLMGLDPDPEAHQKILLKLAGLLYRRGNYRVAAVQLQQLLDRYPANPRSISARHVLADCYRRLAEQEKQGFQPTGRSSEDVQVHARDQYRLSLNMAAANYQKLEEDLNAARLKGPLSDTDAAILREAEFAEVDCRYNLGQYDLAVRLCEALVERHAGGVESLVAYKQMLRCYWVMGQSETDKDRKALLAFRAKETLKAARARLNHLSDAAFGKEGDVTHSRKWWEQWLDWASHQW